MRRIPLLTLSALLVMAAGCTPPKAEGPAAARLPGEVLFKHHCASCHGVSGVGDGPVAAGLLKKPSDLTTLQQRRDGKFPAMQIAEIIDGRKEIAAHGSRSMPVWGQKYGAGQEPGAMREEQISGNLLALVDYLESIQKK
jgi:mono/diheme cytochrome c family protein